MVKRFLIGIGVCLACILAVHTVFATDGSRRKSKGAFKVGETYDDPGGRFSALVTDDRDLRARQTPEGVVFEGRDIDRGDIVYAVLVYEIPTGMPGSDQDILKASWNGLVMKAEKMGGSLTAVHMQESECQGPACLDVYYRSALGKNSLKRAYISRFIKKGSRVYNLYYSYVSMYQSAFDETIYTTKESFDALVEPAEKFFAGVEIQ